MGRAIPPEGHGPHHLKEQHHLRGSITQGTAALAALAALAAAPGPQGSRGGEGGAV